MQKKPAYNLGINKGEGEVRMVEKKTSFQVAVGSINYNLVHAKSDIDKKLFYYPTFDDLYFGDKNSISKVTKTEDLERHDIRKLPSMLYKANVNFLETLFSVQVDYADSLYQTLVKRREEIARMNLPYLYDACFKGMYERKMKEFLRDTSYINIHESEQEIEDKVNKHLMVAYRILDFLVRYARNGFTSFASAIRYDESIKEDKEMKEFLFSIRDGKVGKQQYFNEIPSFIEEKRKEVESLREIYKSHPINHTLNSEIEKLVKAYVQLNLLEEIKQSESLKHDWEATDNQGYAMECSSCDTFISVYESETWNRELNAICESKFQDELLKK